MGPGVSAIQSVPISYPLPPADATSLPSVRMAAPRGAAAGSVQQCLSAHGKATNRTRQCPISSWQSQSQTGRHDPRDRLAQRALRNENDRRQYELPFTIPRRRTHCACGLVFHGGFPLARSIVARGSAGSGRAQGGQTSASSKPRRDRSDRNWRSADTPLRGESALPAGR